ncbi:MAG: glycosyltransferase [Promethearchaeota archaeon]
MTVNFSIVIPVYNAKRTIRKCVDSLLGLKGEIKHEIILVDDGSNDGTREILKEYAKEHPDLKIITQSNNGPASARNNGIKNSKNDIIVFTDSDCEVPKDFLEKYARYFNMNKISIIGGKVKPVSKDNAFERFEDFRKIKLYGTKMKKVEMLPSCNLAIKREVFDKIGLFDETFKRASSEDYDLCYRARKSGFEILFVPDIFVYHHHPQNLKGVLKRGFIHAKEAIKLKKKHEVYNFLKEFLKYGLFKSIFLPLKIAIHYPLKLYIPAFLYELAYLLGELDGLVTYR